MDSLSAAAIDRKLIILKNSDDYANLFGSSQKNKYSVNTRKRILEIRKSIANTSTAKFAKMVHTVGEDSRIRGTLLYHGCSTGRWSGKGVQFQNFPKPKYDNVSQVIDRVTAGEDLNQWYNPMEAYSTCLRGCISAPPGHKLLVVDYSAIEAVVTAWLGGQDDALTSYKDGKDPYVEMAKVVFNKDGISKEERALGKRIVLALGYGMGYKKFKSTCVEGGAPISEELAIVQVMKYRKKHRAVVTMWDTVSKAAKAAVKAPHLTNPLDRKLTIGMVRDYLLIRLPSGRRIAFPKARMEPRTTDWGTTKDEIFFTGPSSTKVAWFRQPLWGGLLFQNVVQAIARDLLAHGMLKLDRAGYKIVSTVHDEVIVEYADPTEEDLSRMIELMCDTPDWASGIPVKAAGYIASRYRK